MISVNQKKLVRLHLTNVTGLGASQLLESLLPAIEQDPFVTVQRIYLPDRGPLSTYTSQNSSTELMVYRRRTPNVLSRLVECTWLSSRFEDDTPLLVLGDMPLRHFGPQAVFVQTPHLIRPGLLRIGWGLKYWISRMLFKKHIKWVGAFIVQSDVMRIALEQSYPAVAGRVHVISQPVPQWLLESGLKRTGRVYNEGDRLRLIYPAADYQHKNHILLANLSPQKNCPVAQLLLTIDPAHNPAPHLDWIECRGILSSQAMIAAYEQVDALLFLSKEESYGFPLVEAMFIGLPIICPDLPYAHSLCGEQAIYFDVNSPESLMSAVLTLQARLRAGWWPNWRDRLNLIPRDWTAVARQMLDLTCGL
jgi:glycosyltransferase involved in cell wall biosynthesis